MILGVLIAADVTGRVDAVFDDVEVSIVEAVAADDDHAAPEANECNKEEHISARPFLCYRLRGRACMGRGQPIMDAAACLVRVESELRKVSASALLFSARSQSCKTERLDELQSRNLNRH